MNLTYKHSSLVDLGKFTELQFIKEELKSFFEERPLDTPLYLASVPQPYFGVWHLLM